VPDYWRTNPHVPSFASWAPSSGPAGFWRRALAAVIDLYVVSLLYLAFVALGALGARLGATQSGAEFLSEDLVRALAGPFVWLWWVLSWVYIAVLTRYGGQTLGKMLLRIRVTQTDGEDPSWIQAALRPAGYVMSWLPLGAGLLLAAVPPEKRALHDRILGTRVVTLRRTSYAGRRAAAAWIVLAALGGSVWAGSASASGVLVDRILATADDRTITLSDLIAYQTLVGPPTVSRDDAIQALIDRQLLLEEAERFAIADPPTAEVDSRIAAIVAGSGGPASFRERMDELGWEPEALRAWVADDLRIAEFLDQRIYFFVLVSPQDIDAYYETHRAEFPARSLEEAREAINQRLVKERGDEKRDQFLARLHERAKIRINTLP
jgi:uncharacterized RDD family membrane protein YckC